MKKTRGSDNFQTPNHAVDLIVDYIKPNQTIWEPAMGKGNIVNYFRKRGYTINGTDINNGYDFFNTEIECDVIITNPPYSIKDKWIERCYNLEKPFMLLLPLTALEGKFRHSFYREKGISLIIPNKRINYETPSGKKSSAWFASAWFCYGFDIPQQITFVDTYGNTDD